MNRAEAHELVDKLFDAQPEAEVNTVTIEATPERKAPEGKRLVSTKGQGDRKYELDEKEKTRRWLSNPEVLEARGWKMEDAVEITDTELADYKMGPAIFRVDEPA
jgi:hypothetical protein